MIEPQKVYTAVEIAEALGLKESTVKEKARTGEIPCVKKYGRLYFHGGAIIKFIRESGEVRGESSEWG